MCPSSEPVEWLGRLRRRDGPFHTPPTSQSRLRVRPWKRSSAHRDTHCRTIEETSWHCSPRRDASWSSQVRTSRGGVARPKAARRSRGGGGAARGGSVAETGTVTIRYPSGCRSAVRPSTRARRVSKCHFRPQVASSIHASPMSRLLQTSDVLRCVVIMPAPAGAHGKAFRNQNLESKRRGAGTGRQRLDRIDNEADIFLCAHSCQQHLSPPST